jgi:hypothetical protein
MYDGSVKHLEMQVGDDANKQAKHIRKAFNRTLLCSPLEKTGDTYTIRATKTQAFPVLDYRATNTQFGLQRQQDLGKQHLLESH